MRVSSAQATIERQIWSRFRSPSYWIGAVVPLVLIGLLLHQAGSATSDPPTTMFLAVISALWVGGSGCVREIVDERRLVQRDPHLSLLAYALAKILHAGLMAFGQSLILTIAVLLTGIVHLAPPMLWILLFLTTLSGALMALVLSALCDEAATALAWFPLLLVPQVVFGGFLFPYGQTIPFPPRVSDRDGDAGSAGAAAGEEPPHPGRRRVHGVAVGTRGLCRAGLCAGSLERRIAFEEAAKVNTFLPATLSSEDVSDRLLAYARGLTMAPSLRTWAPAYLLILMFFAGVEAGALVLIADPRSPADGAHMR